MKKLARRQQQVWDLREKGLCCVEIADALGIDPSYVRSVANKIGRPFSEEEKKRSIHIAHEKAINTQYGTKEDRIEHCRIETEKRNPGFEYVSGFISSDEQMTLRCKHCGNIITKSAISVRGKKRLLCPFCEEEKRRDKEKNEKRQKELIEDQKKEQRFWNQSFNQAAVSFCPECGTVFYQSRNWKYCSTDCRQRANNSIRKDRRIRKIQARSIDKDITLDRLFRKDGGTCWICGGLCDYSDCIRDARGNFIVGRNYPSVDHVKPLSKGGLHSWDNVRLAHHYCNSMKRDKVVCL